MEATRIVYNCSTGSTTEEIFTMQEVTIAEVKTQKKQEINSSFETQLNSGTVQGYLTQGLTTNIYVYGAKEDLTNYQMALQSMQVQNLTDRIIKTKEANPYVSVTLAELQIIVGELVVHGDNLWVKKQTLYNTIDSKTQEDLNALIAQNTQSINTEISTYNIALTNAQALPETTQEEIDAKNLAIAEATANLNLASASLNSVNSDSMTELFSSVVW